MGKAELPQKLAMEATTSALRNGPAQINAAFASLSQAYASDAARKITMAQTSHDNELSIARHNNQARLDSASPPFDGEPFVGSGLVAVLIDIKELGDRPSQSDAVDRVDGYRKI